MHSSNLKQIKQISSCFLHIITNNYNNISSTFWRVQHVARRYSFIERFNKVSVRWIRQKANKSSRNNTNLEAGQVRTQLHDTGEELL